MITNPFEIVEEFERRLANYCGAAYAVTCHSCTDALLLSFWLRKIQGYGDELILPKYTYVGVPYSALNAGYKITFADIPWNGLYEIKPIKVVDSARLLTRNIYTPGMLTCLSFHWWKTLPIGRGGAVLTDCQNEAAILKKMRYDGRTPGVAVADDSFCFPGFHCYMSGDDAWQGIRLLENLPDVNEPIPWDGYPDLSKYPIFTEGYRW
jgi:dTDP-4-amino-4,6-dideoxygalactose transaminase